jgi:hypothetical protein
MSMIHKIQIVRSKKRMRFDGNDFHCTGWFFRLKSKNGRTLCHSEIYSTLDACRRTTSGIRNMLCGVGIEEV